MRSERALAKQLGGRVQPGSGNLPIAGLKGDVALDSLLLDDKTTLAASFSVKLTWLLKLRAEALRTGRQAALRVSFERQGVACYVITEELFDLLLTALQD